MKRLILLALIAAVAWYGWKHYGELRGAPANELVIRNDAGRVIDRLRVSIGDREYPAYDSLGVGASVTQRFPLADHDGAFRLRWLPRGRDVDLEWSGGMVTAGPVPMQHVIQIGADGGAVWSSRLLPTKRAK